MEELNVYLSSHGPVNEARFWKLLNEKVSTSCEMTLNRIVFVKIEEMKKRLELESSVKAKKIVDHRPQV